jgi:sirohydrochlorin cobaltochelatase
MKSGLILYAHGARDPRWAEPFERVRQKVAARAEGTPVTLAFLEHGHPDLTQAAVDMAFQGVRKIKVVPMFFGRGGHLRHDFPRQLSVARTRLPDVLFEVTAAAGEDDDVLDALASFALESPPSPPDPDVTSNINQEAQQDEK